MKFLVFNLIVGAALVYLFSGAKGDLENLKEKAFLSIETLNAKAEKIVPQPQEQTKTSPAIEPEPQAIVQAQVQPQPQFAPPLPDPVEIPVLKIPEMSPLTIEPEVAKRQKEVLEVPALSFSVEPKNDYMSPKDRRRALMQLAEDMEYFSAKAMSQ